MKSTKAQHRVVPLFYASVILLDSTVDISAAAMLDVAAKHFPDRTRIRVMAVGTDLLGNFVDNRKRTTQEPLRSYHVPCRAEHRVHQVAFSISCTVQVV